MLKNGRETHPGLRCMPGIITVVQVVEAGKLQIHSLFQDNISLNKRGIIKESNTHAAGRRKRYVPFRSLPRLWEK
jgi:hypothetical protein